MNVELDIDARVATVAAAIGDPARARMLYCLMDGHARTSTELAMVAELAPSTASAHLNRLKQEHLVKVLVQGKHRYYSLEGPAVAAAMEALSVVGGGAPGKFVPNTPSRLRAARTCYDHLAGTLGVSLHDRMTALGWLSVGDTYAVTAEGSMGLAALGVDLDVVRTQRRRFAYACLDWSERRPHLGGALAASILQMLLRRKWVTQESDSRVVAITNIGRRELSRHFGVSL